MLPPSNNRILPSRTLVLHPWTTSMVRMVATIRPTLPYPIDLKETDLDFETWTRMGLSCWNLYIRLKSHTHTFRETCMYIM